MDISKAKHILLVKFKPIIENIDPEDFAVYEYVVNYNNNNKPRCCVLGHYNRFANGKPEDFTHINCNGSSDEVEIRVASTLMLQKLYPDSTSLSYDIADINNGYADAFDLYPQDNPKDRVMAFLEDVENYNEL